MKRSTFAAAALALSTSIAFAQSTSTPGASTIGGEPNPQSKSGTATGSSTVPNSSAMPNGSGMTTGSTTPSINDASKSGSPASDNARKPLGTTTPDNSTTTR